MLILLSMARGGGNTSGFIAQSGYSVSGDLVDGGGFTISKPAGGLGTKPNDPKPVLFMPLTASQTPSSLGRITSNRVLQNFSYSSSGGADGNGCLVGATSNGTDGNVWTVRLDSDESGAAGHDWNALGTKFFIHRKTWKNFGYLDVGDSHNVKNFRLWGYDPATLQYPNWYFAPSNGRLGQEGLPNSPYQDYEMTQAVRSDAESIQNAWYQEEILGRNSDDGAGSTPNGDFRWTVQGGDYLVQFPNTTWDTWYLRFKNTTGDSNDGRIRRMFPVHYVAEGGGAPWIPTPNGSIYKTDDVYVDDSWCRVVVGDSATYNSCTVREPQPPSAWSDTAVSGNLQKGSLSSLSGNHLFVVTNDDTKLYVGQFP